MSHSNLVQAVRNKPLIASVDVFGCESISRKELLREIKLSVGRHYDQTVIRRNLRSYREPRQFDYLEASVIIYPFHSRFVYITVDVVEDGQGCWDWRDAPSGWCPVPPNLARYCGLANLIHPTNTTSTEAKLLRQHLYNHWRVLINTIESDYRPMQRASAATLLGWTNVVPTIALSLVSALRDSSQMVRNQAARSLLPFCRASETRDIIANRIDNVIELLNGPATTDRNKAVSILWELRDIDYVREIIQVAALPRLVSMTKLNQPNNKLLAQVLLADLRKLPLVEHLIYLSSIYRNITLGVQTITQASLYKILGKISDT